MSREQERLQERHFNGMCGGDCPECWRQQEREAWERAYEEAARAAAAAETEQWREGGRVKADSEDLVGRWLSFHRRAHRPAVGGDPAVPIDKCEATECISALERFPILRKMDKRADARSEGQK